MRSAGDLSSGCDFAAVKLDFEKREVRVENYRPRGTPSLVSARQLSVDERRGK